METVNKRPFPDISKVTSAMETVNKRPFPDISKVTSAMEMINKRPFPDISKVTSAMEMINKRPFPDISRVTSAMETINKRPFPDISKVTSAMEMINKRTFPDISKMTSAMEMINKRTFPDISKMTSAMETINQRNLLGMDKIASLGETLAIFSDKIGEIDWRNYELTNKDIEQAHDLLENENAEEIVNKELSVNKDPNKLSKPIKSFLICIYRLIMFLASLVTVEEFTENKVIPVIQSYIHHEQEGTFQSERAGIKWVNDELKKDVSSQITNNFRIVTKKNLIVREAKRKDSRIAGKLNTGYVVQILEKKKNWSYVLYSNYQNDEVIEGWAFTRYLKQIK
ncbi:SH3 domain-containing protein [Virgibacillus ndiopensis]|uniref:SH3 domain-containing protein n=1 Tax=Virgibacillus ndiopensis TaxID=2004408 RepID=UPI00159BB7D3|nr:SH3 domain-containing protein [Virgibacillus ndiopensis]